MTIKDTFLKVFKRKAKADVDYPVNDVVNHDKHVAHDFDGNEVKVPVFDNTVNNTLKAHLVLKDPKLANKQVEDILETFASQQVIKEMANHLHNYLPNAKMDICTDIAKKVARLYTVEIFGANRCDVLTEDLAGVIWGEATGRPSMYFHEEGNMQYHLYMAVTEAIHDMWLKYFKGETARKTDNLVEQHLVVMGKMPTDPEEAKQITAAYALYYDIVSKVLDKGFLSMEAKTKERICQAVEYVCKSFFTASDKERPTEATLILVGAWFESLYWERDYVNQGFDSKDYKVRAYWKVREMYKHLFEVYGDTTPSWAVNLYFSKEVPENIDEAIASVKDDLSEFKATLAKYLFDNYPKDLYHAGVECFTVAAEAIIGFETRFNKNVSVEDIKPLVNRVYAIITGGRFTEWSDLKSLYRERYITEAVHREQFCDSVIVAASMWTTYSGSPIATEDDTVDDVYKRQRDKLVSIVAERLFNCVYVQSFNRIDLKDVTDNIKTNYLNAASFIIDKFFEDEERERNLESKFIAIIIDVARLVHNKPYTDGFLDLATPRIIEDGIRHCYYLLNQLFPKKDGNPPWVKPLTPTDVSKEMIRMANIIALHKTLHPNIVLPQDGGFIIKGDMDNPEEAQEIIDVARSIYSIITDRRQLDDCSAEVRQRYINAIVGIKRNIQVLNITSKYHLWIYLRNDLYLAQVYDKVQDVSVDKCLDAFYIKRDKALQPADIVGTIKDMEAEFTDNFNTVKKVHDKVQEDELIELMLPAVEDHFSRFVSSTRKLRQNNKHKAIAKAFIDNMALSHKFDVCLKMRQAFLKDENVRDDVKHINELRKEYRDTLLSAYDILTTIKDNYYDSKKAPMIPQDPMNKTDHPNIFVTDAETVINGSETDNEDAKHIVETAKKVYAALHHVDESQFATMRDTIRIEYINAMVNIKKHLSNPTNVTNYSSEDHYRSLCYTLAMIIKLNTSLSWATQAMVGTILMKAFAEGHTEKFSVINTLASNIYIGSTGALSESLKDAGTNAVMKFTEAAKYVASHYFNNVDHDNINGEALKLVDPVASILWDTTNNAVPISLDTILIAKGIQNGLDYLRGRYYKTVPAWAFASDIRTKKDSLMDKTEFINHLSRSIYVCLVGPNNAEQYDSVGDAPLNNWVDNFINTVYTNPTRYDLSDETLVNLTASLHQVWLCGNGSVFMSHMSDDAINSRCNQAIQESIQYLRDSCGMFHPKWWVEPTVKKEESIKEVIQEAIKKEEAVQQLHHVPDELVYTLRNALHDEFKHIERYNWQYLTEAVKNDINAAVTAFLVNYRTPDASPNGRAHKLGVATKMHSVITTFDTPELNHEEVKNVTHIALHNFVVKMCDVVEKWKRDFPGTFIYKEPTPVKDDSQKHIEECAQLLWKEITFNRTPGAYTNLSVAIQKLYENAASVAINYIKSRGDDFDQTKYSAVVNELLTELCFDSKYSTYTDLNALGKTKYISAVAQVHTYLTNLQKAKTTTVILSTSKEDVQKMARILHSVDHTEPTRNKSWEELTNGIQARYSMQALQVIDKMRADFATTNLINRDEATKILADVYRAEGTYCDYRTWSELPEDVKEQLLEKADKRINQVAQK